MEFRFRAGDGGSHRPFSRLSRPRDRHLTSRALPGALHGGPPPPPPQIEREAAARRERIIHEEVERRLIEEEVCRELALARARLHGGLGPEPFFVPDRLFVPPPPGPLLGVDVPFMPPPPMPAGMHPNEQGPWQVPRPRRCGEFGRRKLINEARRKPLPPPKPRYKLKVETSESTEVLSSETKGSNVKSKADDIAVNTEPTPSSEANISGVKRKANVIAATTEPTKSEKAAPDWSCALCKVRATSEANLNTHLEGKKHRAKLAQCGVVKVIGDYGNGFQATTGNKGCNVKSKADDIAVSTEPTPSSDANIYGVKRKADVIAAATEPTKSEKAAPDWSCALCKVRATSEANLNTHLEGKKHRAKLAQCGVVKVIGDYDNGFQATTGNKDSECPTDTYRKISIVVDGEMHEVIQKSNYLWCERCGVRCETNMTMAAHLRGKKHSGLNKVWKSIKAARLNKIIEGSADTCKRKVNEDDPIKIPEEGIIMVNELNENGLDEIRVEMKKETTKMAEEVNENSPSESPVEIKKEDTDITTEINRNGHIEIRTETEHEDADMASETNEENDHVKVPMGFQHEETDMDVNRSGFTEIPAKDMKEGADMTMERNAYCSSGIPIQTSKETLDMAGDETHLVPKEE